ncbi:hypothetical protein [Hydrogenophaga sp. R2]|uniref:hypothetical protein n=1 Tax=Hydrogenophaga sp. R2 TaxID=3132827 RepID=UPI003CF58F78
MKDPTEMSHELGTQAGGDDPFSLLLTVLENLWLLLGCSLGAGLIALAFALLTPARYISTATIDPVAGLPLEVDHQALLTLRGERQKLLPLLLKSPDTMSRSRQRIQLGSEVVVAQVRARPDGSISLQVQGPTPQAAQVLAQTLIDVALEKSRPSADELIRLEAEFRSMDEQAQALRRAAESLRLRLAAADANGDVSGQLASNLGAVIGNIDTLERRMSFNRLIATGATEDVVLEAPTTPVKAAGLGHLAWLALGTMAGLMAGLIGIFLRESFRQFRPHPEQAARMRALFARWPFARKG